jgi:hypothetical protein
MAASRLAVRAATVFLGLGASLLPAQADNTAAVHSFLKSYLINPDPATRVAIGFSDLNGDGKNEVVVYVMGPGWCGTGGCSALVLSQKGSTYRVVMDASVSRLPISVLPTKSHGWHDLGVTIGGGGGETGVAEMKFNGKTYPDNPTGPPAKLLRGDGGGKVLIPDSAEGEPL